MKIRYLIIGIVFILFSISCTSDSEDYTGYRAVDYRLWTLFELFEQEGNERGIDVDLRDFGISADISALGQNTVAGLCRINENSSHHIIIDDGFWVNADNLLQEMVVFHELGHCFLGKSHKEDSFSDGTCVSIMRSGLDDCVDNYNLDTRSQYLDELFSK